MAPLVPLWLKIAYTAFVGVLVPVNWRQYGVVNFLWFSDIAVFLTAGALWGESRLLFSMAALAVLLPEAAWNVDFFWRLISGRPGIGLSGYMFDARIAWPIRALSLFHVWLPGLLVWLLSRYGYDQAALGWQTGVALVVVPLSYWWSNPEENVNWVYGYGGKPQRMMAGPLFAGVMAAAFPLLIYLPTHLVLRMAFPP
jgi:hypothetical protein